MWETSSFNARKVPSCPTLLASSMLSAPRVAVIECKFEGSHMRLGAGGNIESILRSASGSLTETMPEGIIIQ